MKHINLLTIGIPTYNGGHYIEDTIRNIFSQIGYNIDEVEILISDNASTDNTYDIIHSLQREYPGAIKYFLNESNCGYDKNVDLLFKRASCKYVHIHGDDDYYSTETALSEVIHKLKQNDHSVVLFSSIFKNIDSLVEYENILSAEDVLCENGDDFFCKSKWSTAAVSSVLIKKDLWNEQDLECYMGTQWIHVGALIKILSIQSKSLIVSRPLITIRIGNPRWASNFGNQYYAGLVHLSVMKDLINFNYQTSTYELFLESRFNNNLRDIIFIGPKDYRKRILSLKKLFNFFWRRPTFWFLHLPAILIPSFFYQRLRLLTKNLCFRRVI